MVEEEEHEDGKSDAILFASTALVAPLAGGALFGAEMPLPLVAGVVGKGKGGAGLCSVVTRTFGATSAAG